MVDLGFALQHSQPLLQSSVHQLGTQHKQDKCVAWKLSVLHSALFGLGAT